MTLYCNLKKFNIAYAILKYCVKMLVQARIFSYIITHCFGNENRFLPEYKIKNCEIFVKTVEI
jgi:hypothetical protein